MDKEWTTREGQVTYLINAMRRPGYLPALAHPAGCALRFYLCHLLYHAFRQDTPVNILRRRGCSRFLAGPPGKPGENSPGVLRMAGRTADGDRPPRVHDKFHGGQPAQPDPVDALLHPLDPVHREEQQAAPAPADENTGQQMDLPLPDPADGVGRGVFPLQQEDIAVVQLPLAGVRLRGRPQRGQPEDRPIPASSSGSRSFPPDQQRSRTSRHRPKPAAHSASRLSSPRRKSLRIFPIGSASIFRPGRLTGCPGYILRSPPPRPRGPRRR